ncbi:hypothetical protein V7S43_012896 [Phytophthora oleae]|uniref:Uncharacterized protein n=1 Tax=Phytophthora oleae TaxID=2107226 RepID=A0ABD3F803_9STRA
MSSSFARDANAPPAASTQSAAAASTSTSTTATTSAPANNSSGSDSSPVISSDSTVRPGNNAQQSSSSDGSSPMRRLPSVPRVPPGASSAAAASSSISSASAATTTTRSQTQRQTAQPLGQHKSLGPSPTGDTVNREISGMGKRHLYPSQSYGGSGAASPPPMQMQPQYFGGEIGRITTGSSYHNHLSPVSSPAMTGESWTQSAANTGILAARGLKRHLPQQFDSYGVRAGSSGGPGVSSMRAPQPQQGTASVGAQPAVRRGPSNVNGSGMRSAPIQQTYSVPAEDPMQYEPSGEARHPRDSTRYETWTSKQLRKKCSHLKLRGLKNVKKHVMVEALYRYYRNQRLKDMAEAASTENNSAASQQVPSPQRRMDARRPSSVSGNPMAGGRSDQYRTRYDQRSAGPPSQFGSRSRNYGDYGSQSPSPPSSGADSGPRAGPLTSNNGGYYLDEESKDESQYKEVPVTSEDVIRLVDVVLSPEFVDRLAAELSRWQFWVDVREMYIALLNRQHPPGSAGTSGEGGPISSGGSATNSRSFKWSSMQLWEIWKELTFAYTKTCFEFTAAGMNKSEHTYISLLPAGVEALTLSANRECRPHDEMQHYSSRYLKAISCTATCTDVYLVCFCCRGGRQGIHQFLRRST